MTLKYQPITIDISRGGLRGDVDPKAMTPGELIELENGVFDKRGVVQKRHGHNVRSPVGWDARTISKGRLLVAVEDELLLFADTESSDHYHGTPVLALDAASGGKWTPIGRSNPVEVSVKEVAAPADLSQAASYNVMPYMAAVGEYDLFASEVRAGDLGGYYLVVKNRATGATLYNQRVRASGGAIESPKIVPIGTKALIFAARVAGTELYCDIWDSADPDTVTLGGASLLADFGAAGLWDVCPINTSTCAIAYKDTVGTPRVMVKIVNSDGTLGTSATITENPQGCVSAHYLSNVVGVSRVIVAWQTSAAGTRVRVAALSPSTLTVDHGPSDLIATDITETVRNITMAGEKGTAGDTTRTRRLRYFLELDAANDYHQIIMTGSAAFADIVTGGTAVDSVRIRHVGLASKAFEYNHQAWVWVAHESTLQPTYFLLHRTAAVSPTPPSDTGTDYDAKVLYSRGGGLTYRSGLPAVVDRGDNTFATAMLKETQTTNGGIVVRVPVEVTVDMDPVAPRVVKAGRAAYVAGGFVGQAAGGKFHEVGHHLFPENIPNPTEAGAGLANGVYQFAFTYRWTDALGEMHESAPSAVVEYTVAAAGQVTFTGIPTLAQAARFIPDTFGKDKASDTFIQPYMTAVNGSVLYQVAASNNAIIVNNPDADTVNVTIVNPVDTSYPTMPTTGGVLDNIAPPCMLDLTVHRNRLVGIPADDRTCFWYTKAKVKGAGYEWSDELLVRLDSHGDNTAIASFADKLVVFKRTATYLVPGEGANDLGVGGFDTPYLLSGDLGCTDRASVLSTSVGIIFKSARGFYLYDGGLKYIGGPVQACDQYDVTNAVLEEDSHRAIFFLSDQQPALVLDYLTEQWGTYTDHDAVCATVWQGKMAWLDSDARVHVRSDEYLDDGKPYALKLGLGWITMAGALGWQRFRKVGVLCDWKSPHTLMCRVYYRRGEVPEDRGTVVTGVDGVECVRFDLALAAESVRGGHMMVTRLPHQKATAIRLEIEDTDPTGEDYSITAVTLEIGVKPGFHFPASKVA